MMRIVTESGFCHGVQAAIHRADGLAENVSRGERVYLYGDLVNNRHVMTEYLAKGFRVANNSDEIESDSVAVIRAHGVGREIYAELEKKNIQIVDCTCVKVKSIHEIVAQKDARIIIVGKKNHPEVMGILGWCGDGVVVEKENEIDAAIQTAEPICVVAQTTCNKDLWDRAVEIINLKKPDAEIFNTLCNVTARRIENAALMAAESDCMMVIGDEKSANSVELFTACKAACENTFFVSSLEELIDIKIFGKIGIAGSASAPAETIEKIHDFLLFAKFHSQVKEEIETSCDEYLKDIIHNAKNKLFVEDALRDLYNQNRGGKRIRGMMIKLGAEIAAEDKSACPLSVALAYEIFQTAILIHDDIIDKSETRRGKKTIHIESDSHYGLSRAICIGDYGLFLANKILAESEIAPEILVKIMRLFSEIQIKTIEGEIMDVLLPYFPTEIGDDYFQTVINIYEYKTAWYTLAGPIMLGAICGGANDALLARLRDITLPLGMAFQIKDDLLGIFASEKVLGKPAISDIAEKKQTVLYGYAHKNATPQQREMIEKIYGNPLADENDQQAIREIFTATGAKKHAEDEIERFSQIALGLIHETNNAPLLRGLVHYLTTRRF
ncbi:MAG: 4-hydroxy-3-methylbut-2-enyl diphosphate reductase [Clostridiales bacterium]|jgi:4-hydroxy-3-methylbut-2-enyl diphosphate reductase|nr:4-hydroxy-3-methylbut-2-enyl diphosphate reductase [Clostridiales bacterium]